MLPRSPLRKFRISPVGVDDRDRERHAGDEAAIQRVHEDPAHDERDDHEAYEQPVARERVAYAQPELRSTRMKMSSSRISTPTPSVAVIVCTKRWRRPKNASTSPQPDAQHQHVDADENQGGAQIQIEEPHAHELDRDVRDSAAQASERDAGRSCGPLRHTAISRKVCSSLSMNDDAQPRRQRPKLRVLRGNRSGSAIDAAIRSTRTQSSRIAIMRMPRAELTVGTGL